MLQKRREGRWDVRALHGRAAAAAAQVAHELALRSVDFVTSDDVFQLETKWSAFGSAKQNKCKQQLLSPCALAPVSDTHHEDVLEGRLLVPEHAAEVRPAAALDRCHSAAHRTAQNTSATQTSHITSETTSATRHKLHVTP